MNDPEPLTLFRLDGRVAVVTGAADGLGYAIAMGLARAGANIAGVDINDALLRESMGRVAAAGNRTLAIHCDVGSEDEVEQLFASVDREFGGVDILVNNAGINVVSESAERFPTDGWERTLRINLNGPFFCARAAGRRMIARGRGGSIVNISSISGSSAQNRGLLAFGPSKAGLNQLTRDLAVEWAPHRVRVNAIQPCQFRTSGWARTIEDPAHAGLVETVVHGIPMGRMGEPAEMVGPVLFLASDAASMVTGVVLPVDGGNLAMNAGAGGAWPTRPRR
jgi:NAD(P)-dependent dehydrogenase (short-subunit alcohol dehydrogenase family)